MTNKAFMAYINTMIKLLEWRETHPNAQEDPDDLMDTLDKWWYKLDDTERETLKRLCKRLK